MTPADDSLPLRAALDPVDVQTIDLQGPSITIPVAQAGVINPLRLTLTRAELQSIIASTRLRAGFSSLATVRL
jgi:hypothetical protein